MKTLCSLLLVLAACDASTGPCGVREMLARDTEATTFESCGRVKGTVTAAAMECLSDARRRGAPVELEIGGSMLGPSMLLVGAEFEGKYGFRLYTPEKGDSGNRSAVDLVLTSSEAKEAELMPDLSTTLRCVGGRDVAK